jgi:hypothetical protein
MTQVLGVQGYMTQVLGVRGYKGYTLIFSGVGVNGYKY